jgi:ATP-binding cassette subfamily F protein 3
LEEIWADSNLTHTQIRTLLATFLFRGDDVFKEIKVLSGGERARLVLAKLMQKKVNLLLLDEPTNHLDIESREALENAILQFDGTVIAVSHDRYFIRKIATRILNFAGNGRVFPFDGDYDSFQESRCKPIFSAKNSTDEQKSVSLPTNDWEEKKKKKQEERKRLGKIAKIESELEAIDVRLKEIEQLSSAVSSDYQKLQELYDEKSKLEEKSELLFSQWSELEEG